MDTRGAPDRRRAALQALERAVPAVLWGAFAAALALCAAAYTNGAIELGGGAAPGLLIDRISGPVLALIALVGATTIHFARRNTDGDPDRRLLLALLTTIPVTAALCACAANLGWLAVWWVATTACVIALLVRSTADGAPVHAVRRAVATLLAADAALLIAVAIAARSGAATAFAAHGAPASGSAALPVALLLAVAAILRAGQLPGRSWLALTPALPTPASALLHAGVVNAGGLLLLRSLPLLGAAPQALVAIGVVGGGTALAAGAGARLRADTKGALAASTSAQMGFMLLQIAIGAPAGALLHLVGHGAYKAALFLGAGGAIDARRRSRRLPAPGRGTILATVLATAPVLIVSGSIGAAISAGAVAPSGPATFALAAGTLTALTIAGGAARRAGGLPLAASAAVGAACALGLVLYALVAAAAHRELAGSLGEVDSSAAPLAAAALVAFAALAVWTPQRLREAAAARLEPTLVSLFRPFPRRRIGGTAPTLPVPLLAERERLALRADVQRAAEAVAPVWPLDQFIAVDPLTGLHELPYADAAAQAEAQLGARLRPERELLLQAWQSGRIQRCDLDAALRRRSDTAVDDAAAYEAALLTAEPAPVRRPCRGAVIDRLCGSAVADQADDEVFAACADQLRRGVLVEADAGALYGDWLRSARADRLIGALRVRGLRAALRSLAEQPEAAIVAALDALGVPAAGREAELQLQLARMHGWAGFIHRQNRHGSPTLVGLLAIRLSVEALLAGAVLDRRGPAAGAVDGGRPVGASEIGPLAAADEVWQEALERGYRRQLTAELDRAPSAPGRRARPAAQVVCCIDTRSEGLRRALEAQGAYATLGFAGFFGIAVRFRELGARAPQRACPAPIEPQALISEIPASGTEQAAERRISGLRALAAVRGALHDAKDQPAAAFALAEATGLVLGAVAAARTIAPRWSRRLRAGVLATAAPAAPTTLDLDGLSAPARIDAAEGVLRGMGLTRGFARIVLLLAHAGSAANTPHRAALDCGACGGNPGGPGARAAAALLNSADVRAALSERGIEIPDDCWFSAGVHATTTDAVRIDAAAVPPTHAVELAQLQRDLDAACARLAGERSLALPGRGAAARPDVRACDWAQVRPELGLAGCASLIVADRSLSAGADLGRRSFLHSYDREADADGRVLEAIMTAPLAVAQWISMQYLASTCAPRLLGAGPKPLLNAVGGVAALRGAHGDLAVGLPEPSVRYAGRPVHEPLRLLVVVDAPRARIDAVLKRARDVGRLVENGWVSLVARDDDEWWERLQDGCWCPDGRGGSRDADADAVAVLA